MDRTMVDSDQKLRIWLIIEEINIKRESLQQILPKDLEMRKNSSKMVPKIFTDKQIENQLHVLSDLLSGRLLFRKYSVFNMTWKQNIRTLSRKKKSKNLPKLKTAYILFAVHVGVFFFGQKRTVYHKFSAQKQNVNQNIYLESMKGLWNSARRKRTKLWSDKRIRHHSLLLHIKC